MALSCRYVALLGPVPLSGQRKPLLLCFAFAARPADGEDVIPRSLSAVTVVGAGVRCDLPQRGRCTYRTHRADICHCREERVVRSIPSLPDLRYVIPLPARTLLRGA